MKVFSGIHIYLQCVLLDKNLIEKMEILENLVEVGSQLSFVQEFYGFTEEIHKIIGCKETECDYKKKKFLLQAIKFPNIFNAMFQLKTKGARNKHKI